MKQSTDTIFLTGVTGTLGKEFVQKLLSSTDAKLILLIRNRNRLSHWDRARKLFQTWGYENALGTRVQVLDGDVTFENFGLNEEDQQLLLKDVTHFFHIAALTELNGSEEDCYNINLGGTKNAVSIAWWLRNKGKLQRFFYFSTAYVAGSLQTYVANENSLPEEPAHANFYESSKYNSEKYVRGALLEGLPVTIFRPSIVVGDSETGKVSEFNVIYPFMKLFSTGMLKVLPTRPENSFNVVPIDFVTNAAFYISCQEDSVGKTFHLVNDHPPTIAIMADVVHNEFPDFPEIEVIDPNHFKRDQLEPMQQAIYDILQPYLGYLNDHLSFDMTNTRKALAGSGISLPNTDYACMKRLLQYAFDAGYLVTP